MFFAVLGTAGASAACLAWFFIALVRGKSGRWTDTVHDAGQRGDF
jgi:hypothetical protein